MALSYKGSENPTIGVEIELQILHPKTLDLFPKAEEFIKLCQDKGIHHVKSEIHQSMLEIDTEICENVKTCKQSLIQTLLAVEKIAKELEVKIAIAGTHPFQKWTDRLFTNDERYQMVHEKYQWLARRMNVYGMHVHIGVKEKEKVLKLSNFLTRFLPHLLALSANSPYWQEVDTGMNSCRINIMESFPLAGVPKSFKTWQDFELYFETLKTSHAIESMKDLYWFIRPNLDFGTIEFRICDAMKDLQDTIAIVAFIQCLVVYTSDRIDKQEFSWNKKYHWIAPANLLVATRDGLCGFVNYPDGEKKSIREEIEEIVTELLPTAEELNCKEELLSIYAILEKGNGAKKQREIFEKTSSFTTVVQSTVLESHDLIVSNNSSS